ncbi:MAG: GGDEF domain-containing protein [Actinomycetota bacterium]
MDQDELEQLVVEARHAAFGAEHEAFVARVDDALAKVSGPGDRGSLLLARAMARQGDADSAPSASDAEAAAGLLRTAGRVDEAAYASAAAAGMHQRAGNIGRSVDLSVDAMVLLAEAGTTARDSVRAANALAVLFGQMTAFELAWVYSQQAVGTAFAVDTDPYTRTIVSYTLCYVAVEGNRAGVDLDLTPARRAVRYLREEAPSDDVAARLFADMHVELALLDDDGELPGIELDREARSAAGPRFAAWHRVVGATLANRRGQHELALDELEPAFPTLHGVGDEHRTIRAYRERSLALAAVGRPDEAYATAAMSAAHLHELLVEQVGRLGAQIGRRAELEVSRSALRRRADDLAREVSVDSVTGVGTRRWLELRLDETLTVDGAVAVLMLDLDHFKAVNDSFGHDTGDRVLAGVGRLLREATRSEDVVARFGGEEFVVVLPGLGAEGARAMAERIRLAISAEPWSDVVAELSVTTSVGAAVGRAVDVRDLIRRADAALYQAKRSGRNRTVMADEAELTS